MPEEIQGDLLSAAGRFAVVVARWNELVTRLMLDGAIDTLHRHGVADDQITVVWVPGSFEIPIVADNLARSGNYAGVCCLGAVIQGETTHDQYINQQVAAGIMQAGRETGVPVTFGVLTCQNMEQAQDRAGGKAGNKGRDAALAAIEMANLMAKLRG
ncbi:6,7-dimethyl-8-ribityllumazine synthase [Symmachiella dynata]|uniref:6,7-dimethyl-8-ribityllumazine synthase n=1 Tax=Symmachiella dynata TaxID=2527995 RepID=UPI0030EEAD10